MKADSERLSDVEITQMTQIIYWHYLPTYLSEVLLVLWLAEDCWWLSILSANKIDSQALVITYVKGKSSTCNKLDINSMKQGRVSVMK